MLAYYVRLPVSRIRDVGPFLEAMRAGAPLNIMGEPMDASGEPDYGEYPAMWGMVVEGWVYTSILSPLNPAQVPDLVPYGIESVDDETGAGLLGVWA